jgi:hypothetical protein
MATPLTIFSLGMATVIGAVGVGFGSSYFLLTAEPQKPKVSAVRHEAPPPTIEKVEKKEAVTVSEPEPVQQTAAVKSETMGSGGSSVWITTPLPDKPAAAVAVPVIPFTEPIPAASAPPAAVASAPPAPVVSAPPPVVSTPAPVASSPIANPPKQEQPPVTAAKEPPKSPAKSERAAKPDKKVVNNERREKVVTEEKRKRVIVERWRERIEDDDDRRMPVVAPERAQGLGGLFGILFR